jgi:hypothetical protein
MKNNNNFNFTNTQNLLKNYKNKKTHRGFSSQEMCDFLDIPNNMGLEYNTSRSNHIVKYFKLTNTKIKE